MKQSNPIEKITTKTDRFNEFPGKEIGIDHYLSSSTEIDSLAQIIFKDFENGNNDPYKIAQSMPSIVESKTKYFRYSTKINGEEFALFTASIRDRDGVISIKRKGDKIEKEGVIFCDEAEEQLTNKEWGQDVEKEIKSAEASFFKILPEQITQTSENRKRKLKIRIENIQTNRVYTIGITTKVTEGEKPQSSISIDYVGREIKETLNKAVSTEDEVINDINNIKEKVIQLVENS